jgi:DivIVA domain-containing protein
MIDLTPLDVRKKKGDFRRALRGYDTEVVDSFLDLVADRLEELVRENLALRGRVAQLTESIESFRERERALNEALISAQQLREEMRAQTAREAELTRREAHAEAERLLTEARRRLAAAEDALRRVQSQRATYLRSLRGLLERHFAEVEQEEARLHEPMRAEAEPTRARAAGTAATAPAEWLQALDEVRPSADTEE